MKLVYTIVSLMCRISSKLDKKLRRIYVESECRKKALQFSKKQKCLIHISKEQVKTYKHKWNRISPYTDEIYMSNIANITGKIDYNVVPSNIYYSIIEPKLNNIPYAMGLEDKSQLDWMYGDKSPVIFLRNIHGVFFIGDKVIEPSEIDLLKYLEGYDKLVVKQSVESHGGRGLLVFKRKDKGFYTDEGQVLHTDYLVSKFTSNFVVQEYINQHEFFSKFNKSSLNTMRVMTYKSVVDNEIRILNSTLRIGVPGSYVDNRKFGGYAIGISEDGYLRDFGINNKGVIAKEFNGIILSQQGKVVGISDIWEAVVQAAKKHYHARVLGFDMSFTNDNKVKIIEVNTWDLGIDNIQQANGALFHRYTDEIINYCERVKS